MGDILSTGVSALVSFQRALSTTSHNISNANTEGYSRQEVSLATNTASLTGAGYVGNGVTTTSIERVYDQFLTQQVSISTSAFSEVDSYYRLTAQIDNFISDESINLSTTLQSFFNAVNEVADDPTSVAARQVLLSEGETLTERFAAMDDQFDDLRDQSNTEIRSIVSEMNSLAESIANINGKIIQSTGASGGDPPNDLLDKRDLYISQLSELASVKTVAQDDGALNVFIGNGQNLVLGTVPAELSVQTSALDPDKLEIMFTTPAATVNITSNISGGKLDGVLKFQNEVLDQVQSSVGRIAVSLASEFNAVHEAGYDLTGNSGISFFAMPTVDISRTQNTVGDITVNYADISQLEASNYRLEYDGTDYTLTRLADNTRTVLSPAFPGTDASIDGITISESAALAAGDSFLISPASNAGAQIAMAITDPTSVAAATSDTSTGTVGDNTNALALAALENAQNLLAGTASYQDAYGQVVAGVGTMTSTAEVSRDAQEGLLNRSIEAREAVSGVNLDEEAADLVKYQQAYQAAARLITVGQELFDTLIASFR